MTFFNNLNMFLIFNGDNIFHSITLIFLLLTMLRTVMNGDWLWVMFYCNLFLLRFTDIILKYYNTSIQFEIIIMYKKWKLKSLFKLIDIYCKELRVNVFEKFMFVVNRKKCENILTDLVKEKGISIIIMDFCNVEDIIDDSFDKIYDCGKLVENDRFESVLINRYIYKEIKEFVNYHTELYVC